MSIRATTTGAYTVICDICGRDANVSTTRAVLAPMEARKGGWHFEGQREPFGARCPECQTFIEASA